MGYFRVKMKYFCKFCKQIGIVIFANLLMGCAAQLTQEGDVEAQENNNTTVEDVEINNDTISNYESVPFLSKEQELTYKLLIAEMAQERGHYVLAVNYFLDLAKQSQEVSFAERATHLAFAAQELDLAIIAAKLWAKFDPANPLIQQLLSRLLLEQGQTEDALQYLQRLLDNTPNDPTTRHDLIASFINDQEEQADAIQVLKQLTERYPEDVVVLLLYARLLIGDEQLEMAINVLDKIFTLEPQHIQAIPLYAHVLERQGKRDEALKWLVDALKKKDNEDWRFLYAQMLANDEQLHAALKQFKILLEDHPKHADILYAIGLLSLEIKDFNQGKRYFKKLFKTDSDRTSTAAYYLGHIAEEEKDIATALEWYYEVAAGDNYLSAQARIAVLLTEEGQLDKAIAHLHAVPSDTKVEALVLVQLEAELLTQQKQYDRAMHVYNQALEVEPNHIELLYMRAMLAEKMERIDLLERDLRRILDIDPEHIDAINALGYSLSVHTERYQEAYELVKKALAQRPNSYYILDSMGWILYRLGQHVQAIEYLRKAQRLNNDPEIAAHLGEVLWAIGKKSEARATWEKALREFPDDALLQKTFKRFVN